MKTNRKWRGAGAVALWLVGAALAGCAVGPNYRRPEIKTAAHFGELNTSNATPSASFSREIEATPLEEWWHTFHDPELDQLVAEALRENYDLRLAVTRIRESRYQRSIIAADLFPNIDADAGYFRALGSKNVSLPLSSLTGSTADPSSPTRGSTPARRSTDPPGDPPSSSVGGSGATSGGASSSAAQSTVSPFSNQLTPFGEGGLPGVTASLYQIGFDSTWELDVFGGNRRRLQAAAEDLSAAVESWHDLIVTLLAEVARNYLELRGTQLRLAVARTNLATQNETLELTRSRAQAGLTSQTDVTRAAAQLALTSASIPPLEASIRSYIHALSTLLAKEPTALEKQLSTEKALPVVPPEIPVGLPSELLKRRPDVRRAERQIAAATARIGSAKADLFPKFGLTGSIGLDSTSAGSLFDWQSRYFLISPTATWRIFDAGRIVSNIALQKANQQESVLQYRSTILTALREVEDALVAYATEQQRRASLAEALAQNQESFLLTRQQYEHGLVNFLDVLDTQRSVLSTQDQLAQSDQTIETDLVTLYKALGGGWQVNK